MSREPLVSVILRTRNRPEFLREALESVAAQTWPRVEAVVVNDGGAPVDDVLEAFRGRVDVRHLDLQPGVGRCAAANRALAASRGSRIAYLDDDDLYYPNHLEVLVEGLERSGRRVGYTDAHCIRQRRDPASGLYVEESRTLVLSHDFNRLRFLRESYIHIVTVMHDRICFEQAGGFDESLEVLEDMELFFRYSRDWPFHHIPRVTAAYRIRDDGTNAVTSMPEEFTRTRERLFGRYAHSVFHEFLTAMEGGQQLLAQLADRVKRLEAEVRELRSRPAPREPSA